MNVHLIRPLSLLAGLAFVMTACSSNGEKSHDSGAASPGAASQPGPATAPTTPPPPAPTAPSGDTEAAVFAGGCFWCMEKPFDKIDGVLSTTSGYTGGGELNPTYQQVSSGSTGHTEAIRVVYDPRKVSYERLLEVFWHNIDPTVENRQFCDRGTQYRTGIFVLDDNQRAAAERSLAEVKASKTFAEPIVTPIEDGGDFWPAEEYHQDFYLKNPSHYQRYRLGCGRDARLQELWGDKAGH